MIKEIVITGAACSGKTTLLERLKTELQEEYDVIVAPEIASEWIKAGIPLGKPSADVDELQKLMMKEAVARRKAYRRLAESMGGDTVILYDRGECDQYAFMTRPELYWALIEDMRLTMQDILWSYDGVVLLQTAALGANEHFNNDNSARWSTRKDARKEHERLSDIYVTHAHVRVVNNRFPSFDAKIEQAIKEVKYLVSDTEIERKYLVRFAPYLFRDLKKRRLPHFMSDIHATYLDKGTRITHRNYRGHSSYRYTVKSGSGLLRGEIDRVLSAYDYQKMMHGWKLHGEAKYLEKLRTAFIWGGKLWEVDSYGWPDNLLTVMEVETATADEEITDFPPFIEVLGEITGDGEYSSWNIAQKDEDYK